MKSYEYDISKLFGASALMFGSGMYFLVKKKKEKAETGYTYGAGFFIRLPMK